MSGVITGTITSEGEPVARTVIGLSYQPQIIDGEDVPRRIVVGDTVSEPDGSYTLLTGEFYEEVIVIALDDYGEMWRPNQEYSAGQRIRPRLGNSTGYAYVISLPGNSGATEPVWWTPAGGSDTSAIGSATAVAVPMWWSVGHAPLLPGIAPFDNSGDAVVYEWVDGGLINAGFESGTSGWTLANGSLGTNVTWAQPSTGGALGFGNGVSSNGGQGNGRRYQEVAVPEKAVMAEVGAFFRKTNTDYNQSGVYLEFYNNAGARIPGSGALVRSTGTAVATFTPKQLCRVPLAARSCRVYIAASATSETTRVNAGGDNVTLRFLTEPASYEPTFVDTAFINQNFNAGSFVGWTREYVSGSSPASLPALTNNEILSDTSAWGVTGSANADQTRMYQTAPLPVGDFTHALCVLSSGNTRSVSLSSNGSTSETYCDFIFKNSLGVTVGTQRVWGACFGSSTTGTSAILALPPGAVSVTADVRFIRHASQTSIDAGIGGVWCKLFKPAAPLRAALGL